MTCRCDFQLKHLPRTFEFLSIGILNEAEDVLCFLTKGFSTLITFVSFSPV